jgi:hypothetical protein
MNIDRSNYEIWFIDFLDGNLNEKQVEQLELFLLLNPDLKEELDEMKDLEIDPPAVIFSGKGNIIKASSQISEEQFDLMCAAYLEGDLDTKSLEEFNSMVSGNPERINTLELFRKTKLTPPDIRFTKKQRLRRTSTLKKIIRISATGLSAAAAVLLFFLIPSLIRKYSTDGSQAMSILNEGRITHSSSPLLSKAKTVNAESFRTEDLFARHSAAVNKLTDPLKATLNENNYSADTAGSPTEVIERIASNKIAVNLNSDLISFHVQPATDLVANSFVPVKPYENERTVGKYIARTFREKILKQDMADDSPIKGYEIAEAGVEGLNKLMGWQMDFEKTSDANGEVRSVYFNSKLLKVQAPVNRHESSE